MPPTYDIILQLNHQIVTLQENFVRVYQQIKFPARLVDVCHVNIMFVVCVFFLVLSHVLIHFLDSGGYFQNYDGMSIAYCSDQLFAIVK